MVFSGPFVRSSYMADFVSDQAHSISSGMSGNHGLEI